MANSDIDLLKFIRENTTAIAAFSIFFVLGVYLKNLIENTPMDNQYRDIIRLVPFISFLCSILIAFSIYRSMQLTKKKISKLFQNFQILFLLLVIGIVALFLLLYQDIVAATYSFIAFLGPLFVFSYYYDKNRLNRNLLLNVVFSIPIIIAILWGNGVYKALVAYFPAEMWAKQIVLGIFSGVLMVSFIAVMQVVGIILKKTNIGWTKYFDSKER